jgi:hypothetical protein
MRQLLGLSLLTIGIAAIALGQNNRDGNNQGYNDDKWRHHHAAREIDPGQGIRDHNWRHYHAAPEINPGQAISALALLSGGLLVVRRKKQSN